MPAVPILRAIPAQADRRAYLAPANINGGTCLPLLRPAALLSLASFHRCAHDRGGGKIHEPKRSEAFCSAQLSGRSARLVRVSVVRSTGWVPARAASTISGARQASGIRRLT